MVDNDSQQPRTEPIRAVSAPSPTPAENPVRQHPGCWKITRRRRRFFTSAGSVIGYSIEHVPQATAYEVLGRSWSQAMLAGHTPEPIPNGLVWTRTDEHIGAEVVTVTVSAEMPSAAPT